MSASVIASRCAVVDVAVDGYQAACDHPRCLEVPALGVVLGWSGWVGVFRVEWMHARLDATAHNLEHHPRRARAADMWADLVLGGSS